LHRYRTPRVSAVGAARGAVEHFAATAASSTRVSLVGSRAGSPAHPVSHAKRDIEMVSHHVTLNWRQSAVRYLAATVAGYTA
jgi:hypothetical protein